MNKKIGIGIVVVVIILLAAWGLMRPKAASQVKDTMNKTSEVMPNSAESTAANSLKGLLAMGASKKCTYSVGEGMGTGTVYVTAGKMRGDTQVTAGKTTNISHMIVDGQTSYTWMDGQDMGYKMDFSSLEGNSMKGDVGNNGHYNADVNKNMNFACENWPIDNSKFTLPANVKFSDMSAMMQQKLPAGAPGSMTDGANPPAGGTMEAMCANLQEPAKSQCLAALKKK